MIKGNIIKRVMGFNKSQKLSSEEVLIRKSQEGDDESFEKLIDMYENYLYKMAFLHVKNEQDAMDIYQDTVLKAYLNISKLKSISSFKTWITKILVNNVYERGRYLNKFSDEETKDYIGDYSYLKLEEKIDLYDAIDVLEEKYRTPIILQYFYDLTIAEISKITNCNENTVKTNIRRAKKKMYDILKEEEHD